MLTQKILSVTACLASITLSPAIAAPSTANSPLVNAQTITVHEKVHFPDKTGAMTLASNNTLLISRPNKIRLVINKVDQPGGNPDIYVADDKAQYEYDGKANQYITLAPPKDGASPSKFRYTSCIDMILNGGPTALDGKVERVVTAETLDGRAMVVTTDTQPTPKGAGYTAFTKTWVDAETNLPYRWEWFVTIGGKATPHQEVDFSDWSLNKPIPAIELTWAPPTGATELITPKMLVEGSPAPDFAAITPEGKTVHLSDYKGKIVVLDFWATWCGPCQASMPHLEKVYQQIKDKDVTVLGVCVWDDKSAYDKWVAKNIGTVYCFPVAFDPAARSKSSIAGALYKVGGIPAQFIIDKNGNIATSWAGYGEGSHELEDALSKLGVDIVAPAKTASAK